MKLYVSSTALKELAHGVALSISNRTRVQLQAGQLVWISWSNAATPRPLQQHQCYPSESFSFVRGTSAQWPFERPFQQLVHVFV